MSRFVDYLELTRSPSSSNAGSASASANSTPHSAFDSPSAVPSHPRAAMNRLIMNYLITVIVLCTKPDPPRQTPDNVAANVFVKKGFKEAAEKFQEEAGIPPPMELDDMDSRIKIRDAIQNGRVSEAISFVHDLYPELLDEDRYLFFHLQQQQLIELIREGRIDEALRFASEHLAESGEEDPAVLEELERTMALLAFEDPASSPFADLLSLSHRQKVASELNAAILKAEHADNTQSKLAGVLKLLLWSQNELDKKGIPYTKVVDLAAGKISESK